MSIRCSMPSRRSMAAVALTVGLVLPVAGCGGDGDEPDKTSKSSTPPDKGDGKSRGSGEPADDQPLAEAKGDGVTLVITSADRDGGGFVTVSGKVTNTSGDLWTGGQWRGDEQELQKNGGSVAGASLVDGAGKKRYLVLRDTSGRCLCTKFEGGLDAGQTADWYAQFPAPPEGTDEVTFQVGAMPPAPIEISEGE
ncbi:hypothetical protein JQK87_24610 [Streptomyces sp. G44]|uniref:hypothetical protein n=1 Tax=Streptomyces sp. G44 TaxID=2807632 RepID=UPI0019613E0B|nr:hypothetical protein [Streptomyces sp. G44]MBM7171532.1 hypothetical protein [Streptomyces sp. G44]